MGKQSTRENKTIYQLFREAAGLTRAEASDKMEAVSDSKIEKFEYETQEPTPYDIIQMADAYKLSLIHISVDIYLSEPVCRSPCGFCCTFWLHLAALI